jgi:LPXTG-site transpeptidase (sortase) family protein
MNGVRVAVRLVRAVQNAWGNRWVFLTTFLVVLFLSFSFLLSLDFIPTGKSARLSGNPPVTLVSGPSTLSPNALDAVMSRGQQPVKIEIPSIKLSATIANPTTTNVQKLDEYLLKGAVRYPTSGLLGENGNVVLFAHSSYLPIVNNLAYKTFDDIQKLKLGDTITVYSSDRAYTYTVDTVENQDATSDAIPLTVTGSKLTLATCDSFGKKTDRFVVTAHLVESHPITSS